jgi:diguanylate cyclase (GGDEF)-like protein
VDGQVVTLIASDGLCDLFGYKTRAEAIEKMNNDMYWNVHPDDAQRVVAVAVGFIKEDKPYNLVCRVKVENRYRLIHTRGRHIMTETGERLAVVWYIDEGAVVLDAAIAEEEIKIEELKTSMNSLLNNMPAMAVTKNVENGTYLACNQMFAEYAKRKNPEAVAGLTDHDIFDNKTADHFVTDDKIALSMDEPYIFFEDVPDAAGNPHRFQTTKLKFIDTAGRLCLLGMSMDVTEMMNAQKEKEQAKAAYQKALNTSAVYEGILDALSGDYFDLYYVDLETGEYTEYGSWTEEGQRSTEKRGTDFFAESMENSKNFIYEEDLELFTSALNKEKLLEEIRKHRTCIYYYRLLIDGIPTYVSMKVTRVVGDDRHIIIGISNVDTQMKDRIAAARALEDRKSYLRLSALNGNLIVLYYVDPETGEYTEFSSSRSYKDLGIANHGTDFFKETYQNSLKTVHPEDLAMFHAQVSKKNILAAIERDGVFILDYRLLNDELPTYVRLRAAKVEENGKSLLIIGLLDEDAHVRQEQEYARNLSAARKIATIDSLTGVKNKHAYVQLEEKINDGINEGTQEPFAVVVCDINNLKAVNDLYGHKEGDVCIRNGCLKICKVFSHSPVFRIGGDEFVVILSGEDYCQRTKLMEQINELPANRSKIRIGETIAAGMVEYDPHQHYSLSSVFEEADKAMYERKQRMKEAFSPDYEPSESDLRPQVIPAINVRKAVLIVDDIEMNRDILGDLLDEDYDIFYAADGVETLEVLRSHKEEIDLVLLDLIMPNKSGREVIAEMQVDEELMSIPVIILTADQQAELDCLRIGAMDFIPKPFPDIEIVKARIAKCIELSEDRDLIRHTERDKLTGLLNKDYFFRYVSRLDHINKDTTLDAVVCDVNRFYAINQQYGRIRRPGAESHRRCPAEAGAADRRYLLSAGQRHLPAVLPPSGGLCVFAATIQRQRICRGRDGGQGQTALRRFCKCEA